MRLSELQSKKIIDVVNGANIGNIVDIGISEDGKVEELMVDTGRSFFSLNKETDMRIYWSQISKIGEDVILVKIE